MRFANLIMVHYHQPVLRAVLMLMLRKLKIHERLRKRSCLSLSDIHTIKNTSNLKNQNTTVAILICLQYLLQSLIQILTFPFHRVTYVGQSVSCSVISEQKLSRNCCIFELTSNSEAVFRWCSIKQVFLAKIQRKTPVSEPPFI